MDNNTKMAALLALSILVVQESALAYLYFDLNNPEVTPILAGFAVFCVLLSVGIFLLVRAPETTRNGRRARLMLIGVIAGVFTLCSCVISFVLGALEGKNNWMVIVPIPLVIGQMIFFWVQRKAALVNDIDAAP